MAEEQDWTVCVVVVVVVGFFLGGGGGMRKNTHQDRFALKLDFICPQVQVGLPSILISAEGDVPVSIVSKLTACQFGTLFTLEQCFHLLHMYANKPSVATQTQYANEAQNF